VIQGLANLWIAENTFLRHLAQNTRQIMWFLGAGTSRSAGMPTATDIIWDLKRRLYCLKENQDLRSHDLHNKAIKNRIQRYMDSQGFPVLWSAEEYGFYFELSFGKDYSAQQHYLNELLAPEKISLSIGHRALAALLGEGQARVAFTTNFDAVIETAYARVTGESLTPFHLEGAYAALDALNSERFPIYAKLHGDFRYRSVKNLPRDLLNNEQQIEKCFLAAADRYGLIVTGYSGRDKSIMTMFEDALTQGNPFPKGLYWTVVRDSDVGDSVCDFIAAAQEAGVQAHLVEAGTFDTMLSKIWRQIPDRLSIHEQEVLSATMRPVHVPLPSLGKHYPILRTNALPIVDVPNCCGHVSYSAPMTQHELNVRVQEHQPAGIFAYTDKILFWGDASAARNLFGNDDVREIIEHAWDEPTESIKRVSIVRSFFEHAMVQALCWEKPLNLYRRNRTYYAVADIEHQGSESLRPLVDALSFRGRLGSLTGTLPGLNGVRWAEALSLKLEVRNDLLWLLIRPDIWISPQSMRENATDFLRARKIHRYNRQSYDLLDAWITLILGPVGKGMEPELCCFPDTDYPAKFRISTRTGYSLRGGGT